MDTNKDLLSDYQEFVDEVSSDQTKNTDDFINSMEIIDEQGVDPSRLMTASIGLSGEVGEYNDVIKKCLFQGAPMDEETVVHLKKELGDIMWYVAQGVMALDTSSEEIIDMNIAKLSDRYPGGFDALRSASRKEGDI